jgi:tetratricopeptide (TPR) repeat protein
LFQERKISEAVLAYEEALRRDFINSRLLLNLGGARLIEGKAALAEQLYRQAAELAPNDPIPLECLIQLRIDNGDLFGAEVFADRMAEALPELYDGFAHKIAILSATGREAEAWALLDKLETRFSSHPRCVCDRVRTAARLGRQAEGLAYLDARAELFDNTELVRIFRRERVDLLLSGEQTEASEAYLREAFVLDGNRKAGLALVGATLGRQDFSLAIQLAETIIAGQARDWAYFLCLYLKAFAKKASGAQDAPDAYREALAALDGTASAPFGLDSNLLRVAVLRESGRAEDALTALDATTAWLQDREMPDEQRADAAEMLATLRKEVAAELNVFS